MAAECQCEIWVKPAWLARLRYPEGFKPESTGSLYGAHNGACFDSMNPRFKPDAGGRCPHRMGSGPGGSAGKSGAQSFASATKLEPTYVGSAQGPGSTTYPTLLNCGHNYGVNECPTASKVVVAAQNLKPGLREDKEPPSAVALATLGSALFDFGLLASRAGCLAVYHPAGAALSAESLKVAIEALHAAMPVATTVVGALAGVEKAAAKGEWVETLHGPGGSLAKLGMGADLQKPQKKSAVYAGPLLEGGIMVGARVQLKGGLKIAGLEPGTPYTVSQGPGSFNHIKVTLTGGGGSNSSSSWIKASQVAVAK